MSRGFGQGFNEVTNSDLEKLQKWLMGNKLSLNAMKTYDIEESRSKTFTKTRDHELEVVDTNKYLGLQIDNSLDWKRHVRALFSKVSKVVGVSKHAKSILLLETLNKLYAGIVEPHVRYCCWLLWCN